MMLGTNECDTTAAMSFPAMPTPCLMSRNTNTHAPTMGQPQYHKLFSASLGPALRYNIMGVESRGQAEFPSAPLISAVLGTAGTTWT